MEVILFGFKGPDFTHCVLDFSEYCTALGYNVQKAKLLYWKKKLY